MKTLIVLGNWSSGSTAVTGYIERLGAYTCPPHVATRDERTPNSHESRPFRNALAACVDELTLKQIAPKTQFAQWFGPWLEQERAKARAVGAEVIALKHPLAGFFIPELVQVCDPEFLVVTRQFAAIEKTRVRRRWAPVYGAQGAKVVYSSLFSALMQAKKSYYAIAYEEFLASSARRAELRAYLPEPLRNADISAAEGWIRPPSK